ncbi:MAG: MFS transporter [Myxococcales bacterium]|nr:MFS transporter [Myxococcota bacterium]MDW8280603.1 MFS transporter [Myxococcales bacterium]
MSRPRLGRTVIGLGLVSLLTDASSEMIYPLLPVFLTTVLGAGVGQVGIIEGAAEAISSLLKLVSGAISDRLQRRKPLVLFGYGLSALMRPCLALMQSAAGVLLLRLGDRVGKGLRSGARDALLADAAPPESRGRAYGLHRALDNAGAVIGPLGASLLLAAGVGLRPLFLITAIPGVLALLVLLLVVREAPRVSPRPRPLAIAGSGPTRLPPSLRRYLGALAVFSLGNSSDAFLLLWARDAGVPTDQVPLLWMAHNAIKALLCAPLGALSDRWGRRRVILLSWALYATVYAGCAGLRGPAWAWTLLCIYGVYYALLEGAERALVADLAPVALRGRAFGWFYGVTGACALPASLLFARLYARPMGAVLAFGTGAVLAALAALLLLRVPTDRAGAGG